MQWYFDFTRKYLGVKFDGTLWDFTKFMLPTIPLIYGILYIIFEIII